MKLETVEKVFDNDGNDAGRMHNERTVEVLSSSIELIKKEIANVNLVDPPKTLENLHYSLAILEAILIERLNPSSVAFRHSVNIH